MVGILAHSRRQLPNNVPKHPRSQSNAPRTKRHRQIHPRRTKPPGKSPKIFRPHANILQKVSEIHPHPNPLQQAFLPHRHPIPLRTNHRCQPLQLRRRLQARRRTLASRGSLPPNPIDDRWIIHHRERQPLNQKQEKVLLRTLGPRKKQSRLLHANIPLLARIQCQRAANQRLLHRFHLLDGRLRVAPLARPKANARANKLVPKRNLGPNRLRARPILLQRLRGSPTMAPCNLRSHKPPNPIRREGGSRIGRAERHPPHRQKRMGGRMARIKMELVPQGRVL